MLILGVLWSFTPLCDAQLPGPLTSPVPTPVVTPPAQGQRASQSPEGISSEIVGSSSEDLSSDQPRTRPEPTRLPEVTLFTVLTPARCLILILVGGMVFVIIYGLQMALLRRLR
ncbi:MAG: hypothetical protein NZ765_11180 [Anaerolineae bacterium]|nr:hypothetical protein [Anaerolineae bacterium]MDW8072176.1 hypothetical protein [Anaerolineae bacterium]